MLYLLDEDISKFCAIATPIYTAQRSIHVKGLGAQAPDFDIFQFAKLGGFVLVTKDGDDFESIMYSVGEFIPMVTLVAKSFSSGHAAF